MVRKSRRLELSSEPTNVRRSNRARRSVVIADDASDFMEDEEQQLPKEKPTRRYNNKKKQNSAPAEHEQQLPSLTLGQEMAPGENMDGVPVVELPSSPVEEKPTLDHLFQHEPDRTEENRQRLLGAARVFKSELVARLKSSADNLSTSSMKLLASKCYDALELCGENYTSFHNEVKKLIAQHQKVECAAKDKEAWNDWERKARYIDQVQYFYRVRQKLSSAEENLSGTKSKVDYLIFKKKEMTDALRMLKEELYEEEERMNSLTQERDKLKNTHSEIEVELRELDAKKNEASMALETYNAAKEEFERMSDQLLQLLKEN